RQAYTDQPRAVEARLHGALHIERGDALKAAGHHDAFDRAIERGAHEEDGSGDTGETHRRAEEPPPVEPSREAAQDSRAAQSIRAAPLLARRSASVGTAAQHGSGASFARHRHGLTDDAHFGHE